MVVFVVCVHNSYRPYKYVTFVNILDTCEGAWVCMFAYLFVGDCPNNRSTLGIIFKFNDGGVLGKDMDIFINKHAVLCGL